jgi:hypothetical protein
VLQELRNALEGRPFLPGVVVVLNGYKNSHSIALIYRAIKTLPMWQRCLRALKTDNEKDF